MLSFACDYNEGAHPKILEKLMKTNFEQLSGYGEDHYCDSAKEKIKEACGCPEADVHLLVGGTQTNQIVISALLAPFEGVIAAKTGHIVANEAGAIEYSGHKVLELPQYEGKIKASDLQAYMEDFYGNGHRDHMVFPGMVYISHPTEYGTLYSRKELEEIANICGKYEMPLYLDGARLGYGLASRQTDVSLADLAELCDAFYIGGTKVGAFCGEALVFTKNNTPKQFFTQIKQHGALLAKGRLLGIQFDVLFTDDLYLKLGRNAIDKAEILKTLIKEKGIPFYLESPTNQQFVIMENSRLEELAEEVLYSPWEKADDNHTVIRLATSWATTDEDLERLAEIL
ncbi:MAG: aminotransferase class I/II-fold pyridoxal phosphate-dependent enzyme [Firmicutes bacterium]|nr:aminotransferase class I/II-fold pyridoxal phosphate-dependent enzyme [Bacillota bacterium]